MVSGDGAHCRPSTGSRLATWPVTRGGQFWTSQVWGRILESNVFGTAASTLEVTKELFVNEMKTRLLSWYKQQRRAGREVTAIQNMTANMLGDLNGGEMGWHGSEGNYILEFTLELLDLVDAASILDSSALRQAGRALFGMVTLLRRRPRGCFTDSEVEEFVQHTKIVMRHFLRFNISRPKVHQLAHMAHLCRTHGSPGNWGCWTEEGWNRFLGRIANRSHRATWHSRTMTEFNQAYGLASKKPSSRDKRRRTR